MDTFSRTDKTFPPQFWEPCINRDAGCPDVLENLEILEMSRNLFLSWIWPFYAYVLALSWNFGQSSKKSYNIQRIRRIRLGPSAPVKILHSPNFCIPTLGVQM